MPKDETTYYEAVTEIAAMLDKVYDKVGGLRDAADTSEKQIYNDTRGVLGTLVSQWRQFRHQLPQDRADMIL